MANQNQNLSDRVDLTMECLDRWQGVCDAMCSIWAEMGYDFSVEDMGIERLELTNGKMHVVVDCPAGRVSMPLHDGEWRWKAVAMPSAN